MVVLPPTVKAAIWDGDIPASAQQCWINARMSSSTNVCNFSRFALSDLTAMILVSMSSPSILWLLDAPCSQSVSPLFISMRAICRVVEPTSSARPYNDAVVSPASTFTMSNPHALGQSVSVILYPDSCRAGYSFCNVRNVI